MILGILGGMGPLATCELFRRIIELTEAKRDQDHLHIIIDNNTKIPDRTEYILNNGEDPSVELIRSAIRLENMGADYIAMPCNTAHYFYEDIVKYTSVNILNMIEETGIYLMENDPNTKDYLLLSTEGTYRAGVYERFFKPLGLNIIIPDDDDKKMIMKWIYDLKSSKYSAKPKEMNSLIDRYGKDIPAIIGCTELSVLIERMNIEKRHFDPMTILAMKCIKTIQKKL